MLSFSSALRPAAPRPFCRVRPRVEQLESRFVPYSASGGSWINPELVSISFVPDGTVLSYDSGGQPIASTMFADFDARWSRSTWQNAILKGAQVWARQTNLNFAVVADDGSEIGYQSSYQQGDPNFGDIRIGGAQYTDAVGATFLAQAYLPQPDNNYSIAGDVQFNTDSAFNIGTTYDLFTVAAHEVGHALGLTHSGDSTVIMAGSYPGTKTDLSADDATGIRSIYSSGAARSADSNDTGGNNNSFANSTVVAIDPTSKSALVTDRDITVTTDSDYFKFTIPSGTNGTLKVVVQSSGLSLLAPKLYVYNSSYVQKGYANGTGQYGTTLTITLTGVTAGQVYYAKVISADTSAFGTGKYALVLNAGSGANPTVPLPDTQEVNGDPIQTGGGEAHTGRDRYYADRRHRDHDHDDDDDREQHGQRWDEVRRTFWEALGQLLAGEEIDDLLSPLQKLSQLD